MVESGWWWCAVEGRRVDGDRVLCAVAGGVKYYLGALGRYLRLAGVCVKQSRSMGTYYLL